jgi:hypothetical protein
METPWTDGDLASKAPAKLGATDKLGGKFNSPTKDQTCVCLDKELKDTCKKWGPDCGTTQPNAAAAKLFTTNLKNQSNYCKSLDDLKAKALLFNIN